MLHSGPDQPRTQTAVMGHWLVCLLIHLHRSLICLLRPAHFACLLYCAQFACALHCAHSFARSLTSLTPSLVGQWMIRCLRFCVFSVLDHSVTLNDLGSSRPCCFRQIYTRKHVYSPYNSPNAHAFIDGMKYVRTRARRSTHALANRNLYASTKRNASSPRGGY